MPVSRSTAVERTWPTITETRLTTIAVFIMIGMSIVFFFVAAPSQVYDGLPDGPLKAEISKFLIAAEVEEKRGRPKKGKKTKPARCRQ